MRFNNSWMLPKALVILQSNRRSRRLRRRRVVAHIRIESSDKGWDRPMAYIPENAKWYIATLIEEITVQGDARNVVHKNLVLVRADSPGEAYEKAQLLGKQAEASY